MLHSKQDRYDVQNPLITLSALRFKTRIVAGCTRILFPEPLAKGTCASRNIA